MNATNSIDETTAELNKLVAAKNGSFEWTRGELDTLFDQVKTKENWKLAIDADVTLGSDRELLGMREAVIFFTGSIPTFKVLRSRGGKPVYRVTAAGYYATIGA